jgi:hypothetical protein
MPFMGGTEPRVEGKPEFTSPRPTYEMAERVDAIPYGGIGIVHDLVREVRLPEQIDLAVDVLKRYRPYHESDHVLNIAYNVMVGGHVLDDIEHRRNDVAFLNALGARSIPDPTTAGDFCRRFDEDAIWRLMRAINGTRIGYDASAAFVDRAENLREGDYQELVRKADEQFRKPRTKPTRIKEEIVRERGYFNQQLLREDTAEFEHRPNRAKQSYRIVVLRKVIHEEKGQVDLGWRYRYFFFVTNDRNLSQDEVIAEAHERCDQENVIEQLKNGVRALRAPLNTLEANWAYMVMASLAWTLKAWFALLLPVSPRWREMHEAEQRRVLHMDFRTFLQSFILVPTQIVRSSRRLIYRLLAWRPELPILFRLIDAL